MSPATPYTDTRHGCDNAYYGGTVDNGVSDNVARYCVHYNVTYNFGFPSAVGLRTTRGEPLSHVAMAAPAVAVALVLFLKLGVV